MTRITLRAKSDGTEISGERCSEHFDHWVMPLAKNTSSNKFLKDEWDRVYELPTAPGAVFKATVRNVENVRVMVRNEAFLTGDTRVAPWQEAEHIDASTVVIELEGDE